MDSWDITDGILQAIIIIFLIVVAAAYSEITIALAVLVFLGWVAYRVGRAVWRFMCDFEEARRLGYYNPQRRK